MKEQSSDKNPLVNIVMAVYNPRMDWLREQLQSLDQQAYSNIRITIRDDCSNKVDFAEIEQCVEDELVRFPYEIYRNAENLGSNKTFEMLTEQAEGEYIAYCDQDDIWLPEKIEKYVQALANQDAYLICSDMIVIDAAGKIKAQSITQVRRHHIFKQGTNLAPDLLFSNFVTGCAMMVKSDIAKKSIPFCPYMVHDHYLALYCANLGAIAFINEPLIQYRVHGGNQTSMMAGVIDKKSYLEVRINLALSKMHWLEENFVCNEQLGATIQQGIEWLDARKNNMEGRRKAYKRIWEYRHFSKMTSIFEMAVPYIPNRLFMFFIEMKRKNII